MLPTAHRCIPLAAGRRHAVEIVPSYPSSACATAGDSPLHNDVRYHQSLLIERTTSWWLNSARYYTFTSGSMRTANPGVVTDQRRILAGFLSVAATKHPTGTKVIHSGPRIFFMIFFMLIFTFAIEKLYCTVTPFPGTHVRSPSPGKRPHRHEQR